MINNILAQYFILNDKHIKNSILLFGKVEIYFYAIAIVCGMLLCVALSIPLCKKIEVDTDFLLDLIICIIPCGIVGARLWYVVFDINSFDSFLDVINIREGGLAIYGGMLGGALGICLACFIHRKQKIQIFKIFDLCAVMIPLGQAAGRWGNFFNQEVYGQLVTDANLQWFPLAVQIDGGSGVAQWYQALFFYESILNLSLFLALYLTRYKYKGKTNGYFVSLYLLGYGIIRGILENFRTSEYNLPFFGLELGIPAMVIVSITLIVFSLASLTFLLYKDRKLFFKNVPNDKK